MCFFINICHNPLLPTPILNAVVIGTSRYFVQGNYINHESEGQCSDPSAGRVLQRAQGFMMYVNLLLKVSTIFSAEYAYMHL